MVVKNARVKNPFAKMSKFKLKPDINGSENGENDDEASNRVNNKPLDADAHLISQEIKFARMLAGNDPVLRAKKLNNLKKWLMTRSASSFPFSDNDFMRIWKGLFYCMWMSDKPLVQEALADDLGTLLHCFYTPRVGMQFFGTFLSTIGKEWFGIDQWRIDKFMMLIRRMIRQAFIVLKNTDWDADIVKLFRDIIGKTVLEVDIKNTAGLVMHIVEIYFEEFAKVSQGKAPKITVSLLSKPFVNFIATSRDRRLISHVREHIFFHLIKQSDMGREYQEKFEIWKQAGCPTANPEDIEIEEHLVEDSEEDDEGVGDDEDLSGEEQEMELEDTEEIVFDPRAGDVNVDMPEIAFRPQGIIAMFEKIMYKPFIVRKNISCFRNIIAKYNKYMRDEYPFATRNYDMIDEVEAKQPNVDAKAKELDEFEKELNRNSQEYRKAYKKAKKMSKSKREAYLQMVEDQLVKRVEENGDTESSANESDDEEIPEKATKKTKQNVPLKRKLDTPKKGHVISTDAPLVKKQKKSLTTPVNSTPQKKPKSNGTEDSAEISPSLIKRQPGMFVLQNKTTPPKSNKNSPQSKAANEVISTTPTPTTPQQKKQKKPLFRFATPDEWNEPLQEGETEVFTPSRKMKLKAANKALNEPVTPASSPAKSNDSETEILITPKQKFLPNPFAKLANTSVKKIKGKSAKSALNKTDPAINGVFDSAEKRVIIALHKNKIQETDEYIKSIESSPQVPYDSTRKPVKGLLKPNSMPSPINPFYMRKIGLNFDSLT